MEIGKPKFDVVLPGGGLPEDPDAYLRSVAAEGGVAFFRMTEGGSEATDAQPTDAPSALYRQRQLEET